jgi:hypothetical protein
MPTTSSGNIAPLDSAASREMRSASDLQPTISDEEFAARFLQLHQQLFQTDEPDFYAVTEHVFRPPPPYHIADHQFLWDGTRWHLLYVTGDISRIDAYRVLMEAGKLDEAAATSPEVGIGHALGDQLDALVFRENLLLPAQGAFDKVTRGVPFCFRYQGHWGMLYEVRGEGGDHQSLAWSDDALDWRQDPENPAFGLPTWGPNPGGAAQDVCVVQRPGGLYLIYFKSRAAGGQVAVGLNVTRDFRTFVEMGPVFLSPPMLRGTIGLESPCVVLRDGLWHLFFTLGPGTWHAVSNRPDQFLHGDSYWRVGTGSYLLGPFHAAEVFEHAEKWYLSTTRKEQSRLENRRQGRLAYRGTYADEAVLEEGVYLSEIHWDGDQPVLTKPAASGPARGASGA